MSERKYPHLTKRAAVLGVGGLALFVGGVNLGHYVGEQAEHVNSAQALAVQLNSGDRVAEDVIIEVGYRIPLDTATTPVEGAVDMYNPIKLRENVYGFIHPDTQESGRVRVEEYHYDGPLLPVIYGGYNDSYAHEVMTSVSVVYDDMEMSESPYYSVVMSGMSGDTDNFINVTPNADYEQTNLQINSQHGQIAEARIGALVYAGK